MRNVWWFPLVFLLAACGTGLTPAATPAPTPRPTAVIVRAGDGLSVPEALDQARALGATSLSLHGQGLTALPAEVGALTNLETLVLSENALTTLPPEITQLTNLRTLDLSRNRLTAVPPAVLALPNLERLDLGFNQLVTLPPELSRIPSVQLACNNLRGLSAELERLVIAQENSLSAHWGGSLPCAGYAGPGNTFSPAGATPTRTATPP